MAEDTENENPQADPETGPETPDTEAEAMTTAAGEGVNQAKNLNLDDLKTPSGQNSQNSMSDNPDEDIEYTRELEAVYSIPVQVSAVLGKATMQVNQLLRLGRGAVVELDRKVGEAVDIYVNNRLVARGEVVVVDERLGVTMTEIIKTE